MYKNNNDVVEQLIITLIKENLHAYYKHENNFIFNKDFSRDLLIKEGILQSLKKSRLFKVVACATVLTLGTNATLNFALSHMGDHSPVYSEPGKSTPEEIKDVILGGLITGGSDATNAIEVLANTDIGDGTVQLSKGWKSAEALAISGDENEKEWNEIKNHPVLRSIFIGNVFINSGSNFSVPDHAKISFTDDEDLIKKLNALGEFDIGWESKALELAKQQKTYPSKKIYLSFNNAWCGGYAAYMLQDGHGIPNDAIKKMSSNERYGNYMKQHAPKNMFIHNNKKPLDINSQEIISKLVPGAILQIGKSNNKTWAGHFITITGMGIKNGKTIIYTIEGNTAPENAIQAVSLGLQELYDNFSGLEKSNSTGKIADAFKRVVTGHAAGSGRAVSGKARTLESLQGQVASITLPNYSQDIINQASVVLKGMQSQSKKLTKNEKDKRSAKRKIAKKSKIKNRKKQNSSHEIEGNVLQEVFYESKEKKSDKTENYLKCVIRKILKEENFY